MIVLKKVRWKNLLSTGNAFTEIHLDRSPNTLIVGVNGSGKSTILDALCFGLYGKAFRKIKKDQLVNTINNNHLTVEVEFTAYAHEYKIIRGIKPNVFEIYKNNKLIDQTASSKDYQEILERTILHMNSKTFSQIVILGSSSFVPFMQLPAAARREVIEDLLDIRVFSTMGSLLKDKIATNKEEHIITDKDMTSAKDMFKMQIANKERMTKDNEKLIQESNLDINICKTRIEETERLIAKELDQVNEMLNSIEDHRGVYARIHEIEKIESGLAIKRKIAKNNIKFYEDNNTCPTCTQEIDVFIKHEKVEEKTKIIVSVDQALDKLKEQLNLLTDRINEIVSIEKHIHQKQDNISNNMQAKIKADNRELSLLQRRISDLKVIKNDELETIIEDLSDKIRKLTVAYKEHISTKELYDVASVILKDTGIKSRIIKQYIPIINALVNKYLAGMDFFVKFELNEQFEEKILSRHRDDFTYESFSEGEKMRIDLALLFTWRAVARMKNSASTNLLILDEVFDASLDTNGCDEFLKLIHNLEHTNIFVISHKGDILQDKFRSSIKFEKQRNFSQVVA